MGTRSEFLTYDITLVEVVVVDVEWGFLSPIGRILQKVNKLNGNHKY